MKKFRKIYMIRNRLVGYSCPPLNVFDLSSYALEIKDITTGKMMLLRHALHDKCALLSFACGDQRSCVESSPRTTRGDYTASQIFLFLSLKKK